MYNELFCQDEGAGASIVLLHGFAEDGTVWDNQLEALQTAGRLIIPDLPGSGRSPLGGTTLSMESMADDVLALLDRRGIEKTILIGHSMGGYISLAFAARHPGRLNALGLFHSTAYPDSEEKKAIRRKAIEFIRANGSAPFIRQSTANLFSPLTRQHRPELIESVISRYANFAPDALIGYYEAMIARPDRTAVLREFNGPVLFILGKDDAIIPAQQVLEQSWMPAIAQIHIVPEAGHEAMLENPKLSNQLLLDFINFVSES
ncbi:MAG TPA: alpha/beta fold hydrolase [Puia sp.]|nr:alpha/beta fold hydrolase [Puia sp.]